MSKISIRFFKDREVRAVWDDAADKWWFCAVDVVAVLSGSANPSNYWYVLKNRMKKGDGKPLTNCKGFELIAKDGKHREMDCFDSDLRSALTDRIDDREMFMKGVDYSYYYEEP